MSDRDTDFEEESFDEEAEPASESLAVNITSEWPLHCDGILAGNSLSNRSWLLTPKMLKKLSAQKVIGLKGAHKLQSRYIPSHLYPLLFAEAARLKNDEIVWFLVSTWPFEVMNLNELELPIESHFGFFTHSKQGSGTIPLAESIIRGLLYRSRMYCRMKILILPRDVSEASDIMKTFMRMPVHYLRDLPDIELKKLLRAAEYHEGEKYLETVEKIDTSKKPICWASYRRDKIKLVIAFPAGVIHFIGRRQNFDDIVVGLILQRHAPFLFHFDDLALCNIPDTRLAGAVLDRIANPMGVAKLIIHNKKFYKPHDIVSMLTEIGPVLRKFTRLQAIFFRVAGVLGVTRVENPNAAETLSRWKLVRKAGFDNQPLGGQVQALLVPLTNPLVKLSLVNVGLTADDVRCLSESRHASTLQFLRLDYNDLHACRDEFVTCLVPRLVSCVVLQTRRCQLTFKDAMTIAQSLEGLRKLRSWTLVYNYVHTLTELKELLRTLSRVSSIREVGCRPAEFQRLCGRLFMHNMFMLTDKDKEELQAFARALNMSVI